MSAMDWRQRCIVVLKATACVLIVILVALIAASFTPLNSTNSPDTTTSGANSSGTVTPGSLALNKTEWRRLRTNSLAN